MKSYFQLIKTTISEINTSGKVKLNDIFRDKVSDLTIRYLFQSTKFKIIELSRSSDEKHSYYIGPPKNKTILNSESHFITFLKVSDGLLDIYMQLAKKPTFKGFIGTYFHKEFNHPLIDFIKQYKLLEIKLLFTCISSYLKGESFVFLSDIHVQASELISISLLILNQEGKLLQNELINIHKENDGITHRIFLTKRTIELMNGKTIGEYKSIKKTKIENYQLIYPEEIKYIDLHFEENLDKFFLNFSRLIETNTFKEHALSALLVGPSGTGKTEFVYQLTKQTNSILMMVDYSSLISKWIGETEKNIYRLFTEYQNVVKENNQPVILFFNESDGLMNKRVVVSTSNDVHMNSSQVQLLQLLEDFKGIIIATTNLAQNLDAAFERRFLFKKRITAPSSLVKKSLLKKSILFEKMDSDLLDEISTSEWTPAQLKNCEIKWQMLSSINTLNMNDIKEILTDGGLLSVSTKIGFKN